MKGGDYRALKMVEQPMSSEVNKVDLGVDDKDEFEHDSGSLAYPDYYHYYY